MSTNAAPPPLSSDRLVTRGLLTRTLRRSPSGHEELPRRRWWKRRSSRVPWLPLLIILFVLVIPALLAPWLTPHDPLRGDLAVRMMPPFWLEGGSVEFPLGTDKQGRDMLTRIAYGARISLIVSSAAILIGAVVGCTLGLLAGYFGGTIDRVVSWLIDSFLSLPVVLLALVIVAAIGPSFVTIITIISVTIWATFARQVRGETLVVRESDYVARARVAGASNTRILIRHILPNIANTLIVMTTLQVGVVILEESSLSFIGAGIPRPQPSWGVMVADGRDQIVSAWWLTLFPGLAILLVVLSLNLVGDWLRDFMDPKMRQRR